MITYKILFFGTLIIVLSILFRFFYKTQKEISRGVCYPLLSQADLILNNDYGEREKDFVRMTKLINTLDKYTMSDKLYGQFETLYKEFLSTFEELSSLHTSITAVCDCYRQSEDDGREYWEKAVKSDVEVYTELKGNFIDCYLRLQEKYNEFYRI